MLVIGLQKGEGVTIGDNIRVVFIGKDGGHWKIGFEAPREVSIVRENAKVKEAKPPQEG